MPISTPDRPKWALVEAEKGKSPPARSRMVSDSEGGSGPHTLSSMRSSPVMGREMPSVDTEARERWLRLETLVIVED